MTNKFLQSTIKSFYKSFKKILMLFINIFFGIIVVFIKKDDNTYIFGSWYGHRFADNSMYLFVYLNEFTNKQSIWITKDKKVKDYLANKGLKAYLAWEFKGIYYQLKAKYHIVDQSSTDINSILSINAVKLMLWHGIPIKKLSCYFDKDNKILNSIKASKYYKLFVPGFWDGKNIFLLVTSKQIIDRMVASFPVNYNKIIVANYPRNEMNLYYRDYVIRYLDNKLILLLKYLQPLKNEGYIILGYFPTFRDWGEDVFFTSDYDELRLFLKYLSDNKVVIITKFHFGVKLFNKRLKYLKDNIINFTNVILLDEEDDINSILPDLDLLISDYSGVIYDFLWYEKPIILYPYDLENYRKNRGFSIDYDSFNPGKKVYNLWELKSEIEIFLRGPDYIGKYLPEIRSIRDETFETDVSCQRIIDYLEKIK
ncbi:MAG TPA: hypothetical protein GX717_03950 [Clostridiaceae bacterium]|nr:hypothetical protein [Clostridiaceae bacterium]